MLNGFEYQGRQLRVHFDKFATGTPHHHQQQRTTHDYLFSRFGNTEFNSQSPDPNVLESLKQTYGSNTNNSNSNNSIGSYCAISTGQPSYAPTSVDLTYDHYHPNSQQGSRYDGPLAHHYQRHQPLMPSDPRLERESPYFGYYSSPLLSQSRQQEMSQQHITSSVGTEGDAAQSLFRYSSHWSPHEQPPSLYSSYQQQYYDFYRPPSSHHRQQQGADELSQSMQQMKLVGEEDGESRNGFGAAGGENGNSATTRGVWDPLNRLRL
jgi:hypothetical protein